MGRVATEIIGIRFDTEDENAEANSARSTMDCVSVSEGELFGINTFINDRKSQRLPPLPNQQNSPPARNIYLAAQRQQPAHLLPQAEVPNPCYKDWVEYFMTSLYS